VFDLGLDQYGSDSDVDSDGNESSSEQVLEIENEELSKVCYPGITYICSLSSSDTDF